MKKLHPFILLTFILLTSNVIKAQSDKKVDPFLADQKFINGNYEAALEDYLQLLDDSKTDKYNYNIAICYLNTNIKNNRNKGLDEVALSF